MDGCFYGRAMFRGHPSSRTEKLRAIFRHKFFRMLLSRDSEEDAKVQLNSR
jgi:hypothetical protein